MAVIYEKAVAQDLDLGYGSVMRTMPAGGSATGQKIGIQTLLGAVYSLADFSDLSTAVSEIGATPATLIVSAAISVTANATIPSTLGVQVIEPGAWNIASGKTVTVQGSFAAPRAQCFTGSGSVDLTDAKLDWVYPEWWGAVATKAATGTPVDSTTAIEAAVNSKRDVLFDQGIYGTTGGHQQITDGQKVQGQGIQHPTAVDGQGGTTLKRLSGTTTLWLLGSFLGLRFDGLKLDGNALGGRLLQVQCVYSEMSNLLLRNVAGTSYAMFLSSCNTCTFENLFFDTNYGHVLTDSAGSALYGTCINWIFGATLTAGAGGFGLYMQNAANWTFYDCKLHQGDLKFDTNCRSIRFIGFQQETGTVVTRPWCQADSSVWGLTFAYGTLNQGAPATIQPFFKFTGTRGVMIDAILFQDLVSAAGRSYIYLDGVLDSKISGCLAYATSAFNFVECAGTRSDDITFDANYYHSGAVGSCIWKTTRLTIARTNMAHSFLSGAQHTSFGPGVSGTVTVTQATHAGTVNIDQTSTGLISNLIAFASLDTTPSVAGWDRFKTANAGATLITDLDDTQDGQELTVIVNDANTTFDFSGTNLKGNAGVDYAAPANTKLRVTVFGSLKLCEIVKPS